MSRSSIYKLYRETGRKPRKQGFQRPGLKRTRKPRKRKFTADDIDRIIKEYEEGNSSIDLAVKFGCSDVHIRTLLHENGANLRTRQQAQRLRREKENGNTNDEPILVEPPHIENMPAVVNDFRTAGLRIDEIAERVGISRLQVFEILNANA